MFFSKQVYVSQSQEDFIKTRELLLNNNIPFTTRISDGANPHSPIWSIFGDSKRNTRGMMFENPSVQSFYYIFVKTKYSDLAKRIIKSR